jgi:hypothetical protein
MSGGPESDEALGGSTARVEPPVTPSVPPFVVDRTPLDEERVFVHQTTLFGASVGMMGVCLTMIGIVQLIERFGKYRTVADELLVLDMMAFLGAALLSFVAIRRRTRHQRVMLSDLVDFVFFAGLVGMVAISGLIAWAVI